MKHLIQLYIQTYFDIYRQNLARMTQLLILFNHVGVEPILKNFNNMQEFI